MNRRLRRHGFTLIELLVVITVIVVLLTLLLPAMETAVEEGRKARCAANLHAFHLGIGAYAHDNLAQVLTTARYGAADDPYPHAPFVYTTRPGHWSLEAMRPYIGQSSHGKVDHLWYCPSAGWSSLYPVNDSAAAQPRTSKPSNYHQGQYVQIGYGYYARVEEFEDRASHPQEVSGRGIGGAGQVLMSDTLYRWKGGATPVWIYNHGPWQGPGVPSIEGTNRLNGDGGVSWRRSSPSLNKAMDDRFGTDIRYISSGPAAATSSMNYYLR